MKLARIHALIEQYEQNLVNDMLEDADLDALLSPATFAQSPEEFDAELQTEGENYGPREAMQIFVLKIASVISEANLHALVRRMITKISPKTNLNAFLQQPSLVKYFLGYLKNQELKKSRAMTEFNQTMDAFEQKLNIRQNNFAIRSALDASITRHGEAFATIQKIMPSLSEAESSDALLVIATAVATSTTQNRLLTALDFGAFTPAAFTNPYEEHVAESRAAAGDLEETQAMFKTQRFVTELLKYVQHYSNPFTQLHQAIIHKDKKAKTGSTEAAAKAKVANALITVISTPGVNIQEKFTEYLAECGLTAEAFFAGTKEKVKLSTELMEFLMPSMTITITDEETVYSTDDVVATLAGIALENDHGASTASAATTKQTATETTQPPRFGLSLNMFKHSTAPADTGFVEQLTAFNKHYGSTVTQTHESVFNSKKKSSTGLPQSKAKSNVATGMIAVLSSTDDLNLPASFSQLLAENGLTADEFFSGKSKDYLTSGLEQSFRGTSSISLTASATNEG